MKESVEKFLVAVKERIQFMWQSKNHMKVGGADDFGPAFIHPDFFENCLTVRAASVTAGIIVYFYMSAVRTLTEVTAELAGLTV